MYNYRVFSRFDGYIFAEFAEAVEGISKRRYTLLTEGECQDGHGDMG